MYAQENIKPYDKKRNKTEQVKEMFDQIAPAYDKLNHIMSWGIDWIWRRKAINTLRPFHPKMIMDVATGTGDFAILAYKKLKPEHLIGTDISEGMIDIGKQKVNKMGLQKSINFSCEDCLNLSFEDNTFDAITVAFGVRNFADLDKGLCEMRRVLKQTGHIVILELSAPCRFPYKQIFAFYLRTIIPTLGILISKNKHAYHYLPETIKAFPQGEIMKDIMLKAGFENFKFKRLTGGICTLYTAHK